jgi:hypothetical protein
MINSLCQILPNQPTATAGIHHHSRCGFEECSYIQLEGTIFQKIQYGFEGTIF